MREGQPLTRLLDDPPQLSLSEEQKINETTRCKIIGVTLETRPDSIDAKEIQRMRSYGCTRVQLGIQHTSDRILKIINRGSTNADSVRATRLLKDAGFKIDYHLMPDLPGSTPSTDMKMFDYVLSSPDLQADQWKIYPCQITPWTVIEKVRCVRCVACCTLLLVLTRRSGTHSGSVRANTSRFPATTCKN